MKIRLKVVTPDGVTSVFEHAGAVVRIGRDPGESDLLLTNDVKASRQHARVELGAGGATLIDLASANKTLHNDAIVTTPVPLRVGDRVQIGFTGTQLVVLEVDVTPAAGPPSAPKGVDRRLLLYGGAVAVPAVLVLVWVLLFGKGKDKDKVAKGNPPPQNGAEAVAPKDDGKPKEKQKDDDKIVKKEPTAEEVALGKEREEQKKVIEELKPVAVGHYVPNPGDRATLLLTRLTEDQPWKLLREGQPVQTRHTLVALPGYKCPLKLDSGLKVNLWGSFHELGAPVHECVAVLHTPPAGFDAEISLDRGRVEIGSVKMEGSSKVRVNFLRDRWDVTLQEPSSRVCVELVYQKLKGTGADLTVVNLFSRGKVLVKTAKVDYPFPVAGRLAWTSANNPPDVILERALPSPPAWWDTPPKLDDQGQELLAGLEDWAKRAREGLDKDPNVAPLLLDHVREKGNALIDRRLALTFLAALDQPVYLVEFLSDQEAHDDTLRTTAFLGLKGWLQRRPALRDVLVKKIVQQRNWTNDKASLLVRLAATISPEAAGKAETYQELIEHLDNAETAIRHVAFCQLFIELRSRLPDAVRAVRYDPVMPPAQRQEAQDRLKKLIPPGTVPQR